MNNYGAVAEEGSSGNTSDSESCTNKNSFFLEGCNNELNNNSNTKDQHYNSNLVMDSSLNHDNPTKSTEHVNSFKGIFFMIKIS